MRNPMEGVEISPAMQRMADESMQQAKKAFDMYIAGVRQSFRAFGDNLWPDSSQFIQLS